jgi:hypothetical protein
MEILQTLGQLPLMFIGAFVLILAVAIVWLVAQARARKISGRS